MRFSKKRLASYILIAMVALLIGTTVGSLDTVAPHSRADNSSLTQEEQTKELIVTAHNVFADIAEKADPAIVLITSEIKIESNQSPYPFFDDPFFRYFFGEQFEVPQRQRITEGFGSGFIVSEDGYIVTNEHVVHNAEKIEVTINGFEAPVTAEIAWADFELDLAVLKVNVDQKLATLQMGDSDQIRPGDWAIAIGNPFGFAHTVSTGVISALGRQISIPSQEESRTYPNLIQTDAAINPGNSGGPLLNISGEVIGINTAVSTQGQGIGFAIPVNEVKDIVKDLKEKGEIIRPWLGFSYGELSAKLKEQYQEYYGLPSLNGVIVGKVVPDSPAEKAGLQPNDIITRIDDQEIVKLNYVKKMIDLKEIGDTIKIEVIRNGHSTLVFARIGRKPDKVY